MVTYMSSPNQGIAKQNVTKFWKITHMVAPETIGIFELSMALLIAETTFSKL